MHQTRHQFLDVGSKRSILNVDQNISASSDSLLGYLSADSGVDHGNIDVLKNPGLLVHLEIYHQMKHTLWN